MGRLVKSEKHETLTITQKNNESVDIYKDPTASEINYIKKSNFLDNVRGIIEENNILYAWNGEFMHDWVLGADAEITDHFRFAYTNSEGWFIDAQHKFTSNEVEQMIMKYKDILSKVGNINDKFYYSYTRDRINKFIYIDNLLKVARLIKQSSLYESFNKNSKYIEIFINPDSKEISNTKRNDPNNGVRGNIDKSGNKYIWPADIGHHEINNRIKEKVPLDYFRFAYTDFWYFHESGYGNKMNFRELYLAIKNNLDFLSQIGDLSSGMGVQGIDNEKGYYISRGWDSVNEFLQEMEEETSNTKVSKLIRANVPNLENFHPDTENYDYIDLGIQNVDASKIVGISVGRNEEYNSDFSPINRNDARWKNLYDGYKENPDNIPPIPLLEMPNGNYVGNGNGSHRISVVKTLELESIKARVYKMIPRKEGIDNSWREYAKERIWELDKMSKKYSDMWPKFNELQDKAFEDDQFKKEYNDYKQKMNDLGNEINKLDGELQQEEKEFKLRLINSKIKKRLIKGDIKFNSPKELFNFMSENIEYGMIGIDGKRYTIPNDLDIVFDLYQLQSPEQFYKNRVGVCWDQTQFERYIFKNWNYNFKTYYIELDDKEQSTHTFLVYEDNSKFYYFENSYEKIRGIWESDSIDDIFNFVLKNMFEDDKEYNYKIYEYNTEKSGFKPLEFMDYVIDNGIKIDHRYSDKIQIKEVINV